MSPAQLPNTLEKVEDISKEGLSIVYLLLTELFAQNKLNSKAIESKSSFSNSMKPTASQDVYTVQSLENPLVFNVSLIKLQRHLGTYIEKIGKSICMAKNNTGKFMNA